MPAGGRRGPGLASMGGELSQPRSFSAGRDFVDRVERALQQAGVEPRRLEIGNY